MKKHNQSFDYHNLIIGVRLFRLTGTKWRRWKHCFVKKVHFCTSNLTWSVFSKMQYMLSHLSFHVFEKVANFVRALFLSEQEFGEYIHKLGEIMVRKAKCVHSMIAQLQPYLKSVHSNQRHNREHDSNNQI